MGELSCAQIVGSRTVAPQGETKEEEDTAKTVVAVACGFRQNDAFSLSPITMPLTISILTRVELDTTSEEHDRIVEAIADLLSRWHKYGEEMSQALTTDKFFAGELRMDGGTARIFDPTNATWSESISFSIRGSEKFIDRERMTYAKYTTESELPNWNGLLEGTITSASIPNINSLKEIDIGTDVVGIGYGTFSSCSNLESVAIPSTVNTIGTEAFDACSSLSTLTIPVDVTSIGGNSFRDCSSLQEVLFAGRYTEEVQAMENYPWGIADTSKIVGEKGYGYTRYLQNGEWHTGYWEGTLTRDASLYLSDVQEVDIGTMISSIGMECFHPNNGQTSLSSVTIPETVTSIGQSAFGSCKLLSSLDLPSQLSSIGNGAFSDMTSMVDFEIPDSVVTIGDGVFMGCRNLKNVVFGRGVQSIGRDAFQEDIPDYVLFKGKTIEQVQAMENYPWRIPNPSTVIHVTD